MTWRIRKSTILFALFILLAGIAFIALTGKAPEAPPFGRSQGAHGIARYSLTQSFTDRTPHGRSNTEDSDVIEKVVAYLRDKNVDMKESTLNKMVRSLFAESRRRNLDYRLALAVMQAESNFQQDAVSDKGAMGLMQIKPSLARCIAKEAGVRYDGDQCLYEPEKNIKLGVYHLARLVEDFKNIPTALHAYNAGENRVKTRDSEKEPRTAYTKQVMEEYQKNLTILPDANKPINDPGSLLTATEKMPRRKAITASESLAR